MGSKFSVMNESTNHRLIVCSRFPASEHLNKMADAVVDFDAYVDVRFHLA